MRRRWIVELDVRWAYLLERFPRHTAAGSSCTCGRLAWVLEGASAEEIAAFEQENADHWDWCSTEEWAA